MHHCVYTDNTETRKLKVRKWIQKMNAALSYKRAFRFGWCIWITIPVHETTNIMVLEYVCNFNTITHVFQHSDYLLQFFFLWPWGPNVGHGLLILDVF